MEKRFFISVISLGMTFVEEFFLLKKHRFLLPPGMLSRPTLLQFQSLKIRRSTFQNCKYFAYLRIPMLKNGEILPDRSFSQFLSPNIRRSGFLSYVEIVSWWILRLQDCEMFSQVPDFWFILSRIVFCWLAPLFQLSSKKKKRNSDRTFPQFLSLTIRRLANFM